MEINTQQVTSREKPKNSRWWTKTDAVLEISSFKSTLTLIMLSHLEMLIDSVLLPRPINTTLEKIILDIFKKPIPLIYNIISSMNNYNSMKADI